MNIRRDNNVQGRRNEEVELLASAARLRYAYQIPNARGELQVFRSKLLELAFQWDQSKLVKTILTLVRPATRSGREYGFIPPEDDKTCTAKAPDSFNDCVKDWFPDYHEPAKHVSTKKLSFIISGSGAVEQVRRVKMRTTLSVVSEDQELRSCVGLEKWFSVNSWCQRIRSCVGLEKCVSEDSIKDWSN